jgi:hypothetical protein
LNDEHSNYTSQYLEIYMNQDNKSQPQQGGQGGKPDQQNQQPESRAAADAAAQPKAGPGRGQEQELSRALNSEPRQLGGVLLVDRAEGNSKDE